MSNLEDQLRAFSKTPRYKKLCDEAKKRAVKDGKPFGQTSSSQVRTPEFYAQRLIEMLDVEISAAEFEFADYLYWLNMGYNKKEEKYELHINFKPEEIDRDSLYPDKYSDGAYDIVALLNHGYHAKGYVYGEWRGQNIRSLRDRDGAHFMQDAISRFNEKYRGEAVVELDAKYY